MHQQHIDVIAKIMLIGKGLVETRDPDTAVQQLRQYQQTKAEKDLLPGWPIENEKGQQCSKSQLDQDVPQFEAKTVRMD